MEEIRESFSHIEDTRHAGYVERNLVDVLILMCGKRTNRTNRTCGYNDAEIMTFQILDKNGGRIEKRVCHATSSIKWLNMLREVGQLSRTDWTVASATFYIP